jgi:hypothetical protein
VPDARGGEEGADAAAACAQPLRQGALRGELHGELACQVLTAELLVLAHVGGDDPADPPGLEQQPQSGAIDAAVVGHDGQVGGALIQQRLDEEPRDAGQAEAANGHAGAVGNVGDRLGGRPDALVECHDFSRCSMTGAQRLADNDIGACGDVVDRTAAS